MYPIAHTIITEKPWVPSRFTARLISNAVIVRVFPVPSTKVITAPSLTAILTVIRAYELNSAPFNPNIRLGLQDTRASQPQKMLHMLDCLRCL